MPKIPTDLPGGAILTEAKLDNYDEWINHFRNLKLNGTAIGDLGTAADLPNPVEGYDSDWFAVAANTLYTKEHGLGKKPRFIRVTYFTSASPGTADYRRDMQSWGARFKWELNGTAIRVDTDTWLILDDYWGTVNTGYIRILAWG